MSGGMSTDPDLSRDAGMPGASEAFAALALELEGLAEELYRLGYTEKAEGIESLAAASARRFAES